MPISIRIPCVVLLLATAVASEVPPPSSGEAGTGDHGIDRKILYRDSFAGSLDRKAAHGDVSIQVLPSGAGNYLQLSATDQTTAEYTIANLGTAPLSKLDISFRYRSTATSTATDRGSWVLVSFSRADGTTTGNTSVICQPIWRWQTMSQTLAIPDGSTLCHLHFRMQQVNGEFDIADLAIGEPGKAPAGSEADEDGEYAKAFRMKTDLTLKQFDGGLVLSDGGLVVKAQGQTDPYGFVLPEALCENANLAYEVECAFKPRWDSRKAATNGRAHFIFALGSNILAADRDSVNLAFWGDSLISRINPSGNDGAQCEIRHHPAINTGERCTLKLRWSANDETLWVNGLAVAHTSMPSTFNWPKRRGFRILGGETGDGSLDADVERFALRVYEPRIQSFFQGPPRDLGYFTGPGPFSLTLAFPNQDGKVLASSMTLSDTFGRKVVNLEPATATAESHTFTLPRIPFGWYLAQAIVTGQGAERKVRLPVSITPAAAIREPAIDSIYGITEEWSVGRERFNPELADAMLYRLSQMGIRWYRLWCDWGEFEESPGAYYWDGLDRFLAIADKHGIVVYPTLYGGNRSFMAPPAGTRTHRFEVSSGYCLPPDMNPWNDYIKSFATRYQGRFPYYQIWNEADTRQYLYPFKTAAYAAFVKQTAAIIRAIDPKARICMGGFCAAFNDYKRLTHTDDDAAYSMAEWYAQKPQDGYDVADFHFYNVGSPRQTWDTMVPVVEKLRGFLAANGDGGKPIWNSETSFVAAFNPRLAGTEGGWANVGLIDERVQAHRIVQWHVQSKALGIAHNFNYGVRGSCGMINPDFSAKPAYIAHQTLATLLAGLTYRQTLSLNSNIRAYRFADAQRTVTALWAMNNSEILVVKGAGQERITRMDLSGNRTEVHGVTVLTEEPIYIESNRPPIIQEVVGLRLPETVVVGEPYQAQVAISNPFDRELHCAFDIKAAGRSQERRSLSVPGGQKIHLPIAIGSTASPLTLEGILSGAAAQEILLEIPVQPKKALRLNGAAPARFEINTAAQVRIGGQLVDGQARVLSKGAWKGEMDLSATGTVTIRERILHVGIQVVDDAFFPNETGNTPWNGDGVELFFDLRNATQKEDRSSMDGVIQLMIAGNGKFRVGRGQELPDLVVKAERTATGYSIDASFTLPTHITNAFGFDIAVDDSDAPASGRKVQMVWSGTENDHLDAADYGMVILK